MWEMLRPFAWSALRHGVTAGAAYLAVRYGIQIDDATANGISSAALQGIDIGAAALAGALSSVATTAAKKNK